jgi:hypothetical protein
MHQLIVSTKPAGFKSLVGESSLPAGFLNVWSDLIYNFVMTRIPHGGWKNDG